LDKGGCCYIPPDRPALLRQRIIRAAAALVLGILACGLYLMMCSNAPTERRIAAIMENGYHSIRELPAEYLALVPELTEEALYAGGKETDYWKRMDKAIINLICELGFLDIHDVKMLTFLRYVAQNKYLSIETRRCAANRLYHEAKYYGCDDLAEEFYE
jgi:hypothetical protein